jgi:hypothetical protein
MAGMGLSGGFEAGFFPVGFSNGWQMIGFAPGALLWTVLLVFGGVFDCR